MYKFSTLLAILIAACGIQTAFAQSNGLYTDRVVAVEPQTVSVIYSNGAVSTGATSRSGVSAPTGTSWSENQSDTGNTTETNSVLGFGASFPAVRLADNFTVPQGQTWIITSIDVWGFRQNWAGTTSPVSGGVLQIWNGVPGDMNSTVVYGNLTTDRMASSSFSSIYSIPNSTVPAPGIAPNTQRALFKTKLSVSPALRLGPGTYWIDFGVSTHDNNFPLFFRNAIEPNKRTVAGWNARQYDLSTNAWAGIVDGGSPASAPDVAQDIAFEVNGVVATNNASKFMDYDGDGKTDFGVTRWGVLPLDPSTWHILTTSNQAYLTTPFGSRVGTNPGYSGSNQVDIVLPADYDGDGKTDIAAYGRGRGTNSIFYIINSSDNTIRAEAFGTDNDNPRIMGDYDGDGKADLAVWRQGASTGAQSFFWIKRSSDNQSAQIPWGIRNDRPLGGDFDGDGKMDFAVFRADNTAGGGNVYILRSSDGQFEIKRIDYSFSFIVPGDYDGDGKTDVATIRNVINNMVWTIQRSSDGVTQETYCGIYSTDYPAQGDYNADGKTDLAVWRKSGPGSANPATFWVQRSDGSFDVVPWGNGLDSSIASIRAN